jgi:hypothetical protein
MRSSRGQSQGHGRALTPGAAPEVHPLPVGPPRHRTARAPCRRLVAACAVAAALAADAAAVRAQQAQPATGTVTGRVTDADKAVLESAWITVARSRIGTMSGPDGRFELSGIPVGPVVIEVRLIGYHAAYFDITVARGGVHDLRVELAADPVRLDAIEGEARSSLSHEMKGFYDRRERGRGHFFTPDDIERIQPRLVTDVLRRVPNLRIDPGTGPQGGAEVARTQRTTGITGGRACPMLYFVNGMPFNIAAGSTINAYIRPGEIAGMEVYMGASQIPPQFHLSQNNARCGLVVIWTHSGERRGTD